MAKYIYPAVFTPEDKGMYSIDFPDLEGCYTCGNDLEDGLFMANDALSLMLTHLEDSRREIPAPTDIKRLHLENEEFATLISADTDAYRRLINKKAVKKTLTIPEWLNESAVAAGINFSQVLQEALMQKLNLRKI